MPTSFVHSCIFFLHISQKVEISVPFSQQIAPNGPTIAFPYNNILSRRNIDGFWLYVCS
jgi:hypothetical protein